MTPQRAAAGDGASPAAAGIRSEGRNRRWCHPDRLRSGAGRARSRPRQARAPVFQERRLRHRQVRRKSAKRSTPGITTNSMRHPRPAAKVRAIGDIPVVIADQRLAARIVGCEAQARFDLFDRHEAVLRHGPVNPGIEGRGAEKFKHGKRCDCGAGGKCDNSFAMTDVVEYGLEILADGAEFPCPDIELVVDQPFVSGCAEQIAWHRSSTSRS